MKLKFLGIVSALLLVGGLLTLNIDLSGTPAPPEPCEEPLTYRFGNIDSRFDITEKQLADIMKEVEALWATAMDKNLLEYREDGQLVIHLIYGEDQQRTEEEKAFSERIEIKREQIEVLEKEYERLSKNYEENRTDFKSTLARYNNLVESYNAKVAEYKEQGGVTKEEKNELQEMEKEINRLKTEVDRKQDNLESLRKRTNAKSRQLKTLAEEQNEMIAAYNNRFGDPQKFDQGRYIRQGDSERINIFQFTNLAQLKTVLAHETGHAFGLGHVDNPKSVMHAMMDKQNIFDLSLTEEDISAIQNKCKN